MPQSTLEEYGEFRAGSEENILFPEEEISYEKTVSYELSGEEAKSFMESDLELEITNENEKIMLVARPNYHQCRI